MPLYRWQRECLTAWQEAGCRGIVEAATGTGKTRLALTAMAELRARFPDLQVMAVVPTIPLARQWYAALTHEAESEDWRPGLYGGGRRDQEKRVMVYVVNSARTALPAAMRRAFALKRHVLLICDECHHFASPENRRIFAFDAPDPELYCTLGLSATPLGGANDALLTRALGGVVWRFGIRDAVQEGVLCPFVVCEVSAAFTAREREDYADLTVLLTRLWHRVLAEHPSLSGLSGQRQLRAVMALARAADMDPEDACAAWLQASWRRREIAVLADARIRCTAALIQGISPQRRIIVFSERIEQAEALHRRLCRQFGPVAALYHSGMDRRARERNLSLFREGGARILVSCRCLDEGLDVPQAGVGIVMSSSAVPRQRIQRLGRILRNDPGKDAACLYYLYIRDSGEDPAYLRSLEQTETFSLRYYPAEDAFANPFYEYAAAALLERGRGKMNEAQLRELRACLNEGLLRPDWLLEASALSLNLRSAGTRHERNYWRVMQRIAEITRAQ